MKATTRFTVGTCCGALAAFLYFALDTARTVGSSRETSSDRSSVIADGVSAPDFAAAMAIRAGDAPIEALREALESADEVPAESRAAYVAAAAGEWAFVDPAGFFDYADNAESIDDLIAGLEVLIATDPERVWEIAARFNGSGTPELSELYLHAVRGMVGRDPFGATARLEAVATGPQRNPILAAAAEAYALIDADAALNWAMSVMPPSSEALGKVIETVASEDLLRAVQMMQQARNDAINAQSLGATMARAALRGRQSPAVLANALADRGDAETDAILSRLMQQWTLQEPDGAVTWMGANETHLTNDLTRAIVFNLAFEDVTLAAELAARVPPSALDQWLDEVAFRYGQFNLDQAMNWLSAYQGRSGYDAILARTLSGGLISDAQSVAEYIETSGVEFDRDMIYGTASRLVEQDPESAIQWATRLGDPEHSAWALEGVVDRWAWTDGAAATRWVLTRPRGAARDQMLDSMIDSTLPGRGIDPVAIFDAYDSDASAQRMLSEYISRATGIQGNMLDAALSQAERLVELLTDPAMREQAERQIAEAR